MRPGGGNLMLAHDTIALRVLAFNAYVTHSMLAVFADYGSVYDNAAKKFGSPFFDAGAGLDFRLGGGNIFGIGMESFGVSLLFPIYVKDPSRPNDKEVAYRWKLIFGTRL